MMTEYHRLLIRSRNLLQVKKYWRQHNAKNFSENVTEKAQSKRFNTAGIIQKYDIYAKKLNNRISVIQDMNAKALTPNTPLPKKIVKWWQWYNQLTGLDVVETNRRQVVALQDKLFECQDSRRSLNKQLTDITHRLQEVYGELIQTKREDPKYVQLTIMENKALQEQKKIINQISSSEKEEKDKFTQLATAIKEYHDSQNINAQKYKYLSILVSAMAAIVSLIGSMIINNQRIADVRITITQAQIKNESLFEENANQLSNLQRILQSVDSKVSKGIFKANTDKNSKEIVKENSESSSNIIISSAKYTAHIIITGGSYVKRGVYASGTYILKFFS